MPGHGSRPARSAASRFSRSSVFTPRGTCPARRRAPTVRGRSAGTGGTVLAVVDTDVTSVTLLTPEAIVDVEPLQVPVASIPVCCPSATLTVWASAWLHGTAAPDDVLDAFAVWGEAHEVAAVDQPTADATGIPVLSSVPATPIQLLTALRGLGADTGRLLLPVPGDVRGLGGGGTFTSAALAAGEAVLFPDAGHGVVPVHIAEGLMRWTVYPAGTATPPEHVGIGEAEHGLTDAIRTSAGTLRELEVARERPGVRAELAGRLRAQPEPSWPSQTPGRALRVLQRAAEIDVILGIATADEPGGAASASAASGRAQALRPLASAVRTARCAAVDEAVRVLGEHARRG